MKLIYVKQGDIVNLHDQSLTAEKNALISIDSAAKQFDIIGNKIVMYIELAVGQPK